MMPINVDPDWWKELFDEVYLITDCRSVCDDDLTCREVDVFLSVLPLEPQHRILDLCGGHGRHSLELARRGFSPVVADFSGYLLDRGRKTAEEEGLEVEFLRADARKTGLPDEGFDLVMILGNSLGYVSEDDADLRILGEARRVLKRGGKLLLDVTDGSAVAERFNPNAWHEIGEDVVVCRERELVDHRINAREVVICKKKGLVRDQTYSIRVYDSEALRSLAEKAGFAKIDVTAEFNPHDRSGDYGFMNHRMLLVAEKP